MKATGPVQREKVGLVSLHKTNIKDYGFPLFRAMCLLVGFTINFLVTHELTYKERKKKVVGRAGGRRKQSTVMPLVSI